MSSANAPLHANATKENPLDFLSDAWMQIFRAELNSDDSWKAASKYFSARVGFKSERAFGTVTAMLCRPLRPRILSVPTW